MSSRRQNPSPDKTSGTRRKDVAQREFRDRYAVALREKQTYGPIIGNQKTQKAKPAARKDAPGTRERQKDV